MIIKVLIGIIAIIGVLFGAEIIVQKSKALAKSFGISEVFIGLTILSIGTSLPEISTHILGSINILKSPFEINTISSIALGTNIGSNLIQITLITGIVGLIAMIKTTRRFLLVDYVFMLFSIALLFVLGSDGLISRYEGIFLVLLYVGYLVYLSRTEKLSKKFFNHNHNHKHPFINILYIILGLIILMFSADQVVKVALFVSESFNILGSTVGIFIIGVCTVLPEFVTAMIGIIRKAPGISLGTLVGSNITNPLLAVGAGAGISTYTVSNPILYFDLPMWFAVSLIGLFLFRDNNELDRHEAILLILLYIGFVGLRIWLF